MQYTWYSAVVKVKLCFNDENWHQTNRQNGMKSGLIMARVKFKLKEQRLTNFYGILNGHVSSNFIAKLYIFIGRYNFE